MTRSGFTLAEVVVVMGILILLFSISFASLNAYREKISLNVFAHLAATELYSTQCLAMSKCESTSINFSELTLPKNISVQVKRRFRFSSSGFPQVGGSGTEILKSRSGLIRKIILSSVGRVKIE